jgi:hypothetical protein
MGPGLTHTMLTPEGTNEQAHSIACSQVPFDGSIVGLSTLTVHAAALLSCCMLPCNSIITLLNT